MITPRKDAEIMVRLAASIKLYGRDIVDAGFLVRTLLRGALRIIMAHSGAKLRAEARDLLESYQ